MVITIININLLLDNTIKINVYYLWISSIYVNK